MMTGQPLLWAIWLGSIALVVLGCLLPLRVPQVQGISLWLHVGAFLWLTAFLPLCLRMPAARLGAALALVALGLGLEWAQGFMPGRTASTLDTVANLAGVLAGLACMPFIRARLGACR